MISKTLANSILDVLAGNTHKLSGFGAVYLGLSSTDPAGGVTEPTEDEYNRIKVGATDQSTNATSQSNQNSEYKDFRKFGSATGGTISNNVEINFPTAKQGYKDKITHWFLSASNKKGDAAFLWGEVKDVLIEPKNWTSFSVKEERTVSGEKVNVRAKEEELEELIQINTGDEYIVVWDKDDKEKEVEYKGEAVEYTTGAGDNAVTYSLLGNPWLADATLNNNGEPFALLYRQEVVGTATKGILKLLTTSSTVAHWMGLYGMGIKVGKKTVPTFYQFQLQASIDVEL